MKNVTCLHALAIPASKIYAHFQNAVSTRQTARASVAEASLIKLLALIKCKVSQFFAVETVAVSQPASEWLEN